MKILASIKIDTTVVDSMVMNDNYMSFAINGIVISFEPTEDRRGASVQRMSEAIVYIIRNIPVDMKSCAMLARDFDSLQEWQYQILDTITGFKKFEEMDF